ILFCIKLTPRPGRVIIVKVKKIYFTDQGDRARESVIDGPGGVSRFRFPVPVRCADWVIRFEKRSPCRPPIPGEWCRAIFLPLLSRCRGRAPHLRSVPWRGRTY